MQPSKQWLALHEKCKERLASPVDLNEYFELPSIAGRPLDVLDIGPCSLPSGRVLVRDPLIFLAQRGEEPYYMSAPAGNYATEVCVLKATTANECARYAAVRLRFSDQRPVCFSEALVGHEQLQGLGKDEYFGFNVGAGLACICDAVVQEAFCAWSEQWHAENPDKDQFDDYFAPLFSANYKANPAHQRACGDWLNWCIPATEYHIPFFRSGFGDGAYPVYWGLDAEGAICQLVVNMIDIQLAFGEAPEA